MKKIKNGFALTTKMTKRRCFDCGKAIGWPWATRHWDGLQTKKPAHFCSRECYSLLYKFQTARQKTTLVENK
jgi:hypothetical protein